MYRNPVTGTSMPIPEAMNRGFILVEFTNTSVEADELVRRGVITVATSNEIITYNVQVRGGSVSKDFPVLEHFVKFANVCRV